MKYQLPVLQVLNAAETLERSVDHDCYTATQRLTFFHATLHTTALTHRLHANPLTPTVASPECQSARRSKITNDGLTQSGTGCFIAVPIWQQWTWLKLFSHVFIPILAPNEHDIVTISGPLNK